MMGMMFPSRVAGQVHTYKPLSSPDSTRLLIIFEAEDEDSRLECQLAEIHLSEARDEEEGYTALSYVWGKQIYTHKIWLKNRYVSIGANLDSALRHLRRRDRPIRLWVDAVCINQNDLLERNHQVQQMRVIFSAAAETIIYLGPQDGGHTGESAWNFLERHSSWALNENQDRDETIPSRLEQELLYFRGDLRDVDIDVLSRPWFRRLWVFQEAVVSRSLSLQCGHRRVPWDDFSEILLLSPRLHDRYAFSLSYCNKADIVRDMNLARHEYLRTHGLDQYVPSWQLPETFRTSLGGLNILKLLARARYLDASDARDKIFGLMGIATGIDTTDRCFAVDYRKSRQQLFIDFAKHIMQATSSYDILAYVDAGAEDTIGPEFKSWSLPSWVPNWDSQHTSTFGSDRTILETLPAEASAEREARQRRFIRGNIAWTTRSGYPSTRGMETPEMAMIVSGRTLGRIEELTPVISVIGNDEMSFQRARDSTEDETERYSLCMGLWEHKMSSNTSRLYQHTMELPAAGIRPRVQYSGLKSESFVDSTDCTFDTSKVKVSRSVEHHLYARGRQTATWSDGNNKVTTTIIDKESIVDGKKLARCIAAADSSEQLALVPEVAKEGDLVVQLSGSRVPFVIRPVFVAWAEEALNVHVTVTFMERLAGRQVDCRLIGECVFNGFEETFEDITSTSFRIL